MSRNHLPLNARLWAAARLACFERDGYRCTSCGLPGALECDHIEPMQRQPGQDPYALHGLQTLCKGCHIAKTRQENTRPDPPGMAAWRAFVNELGGN